MKTVTVYGASDDLIELEGDLNEEFNVYSRDDDDERILAFSDGTLLSVTYDKTGCWRVNRMAKGSAEFNKVEADGPDTDNYTDKVTLTGDIRWCLMGKEVVMGGKGER